MNLINTLRRKKWLIVGAIIVVVCLLFLLVFLTRKKPVEAPLLKTVDFGLSVDSVEAGLKDGFLYQFDGLNFNRRSLSTGQSEPLATGVNLPDVYEVEWGEEGAFLRFSGGFIDTSAQPELNDAGYGYFFENPERIVWYFDFSSNRLELIGESPVSTPLGYIGSAGSFFVTGNDINYRIFERVGFGEVREVMAGTGVVDGLHECAGDTDAELCYIVRTDTTVRLVELLSDRQLMESDSSIFPTGDPAVFTTLEVVDGVDDDRELANEISYQIEVVNIKQGLTSTVDAVIEGEPLAMLVYDDYLYALASTTSSELDNTYLRADINFNGQELNSNLDTFEDNPLSSALTAAIDHGGSGELFVQLADGNYSLLGPDIDSVFSMEVDPEYNETVVTECGVEVGPETDNSQRITIVIPNGNIQRKITDVSECIADTNSFGWGFDISVIDSETGRALNN